MKILVTDKCNEKAVEILKEIGEVNVIPSTPEDELVKIIGEYDAIITRSATTVTKRLIDAATNMKIIGRAGVGVDNIDLDYATKKGIIVVNSPNGNTTAAAEHTLAMLFSMARNIPKASKLTREGLWERSKFSGMQLSGKTLGIIGFGKIGSHVGKVAVSVGMKVYTYDPYINPEKATSVGVNYATDLEEMLSMVDVLTVHTPKNEETTNMISAEQLSKMKKGVKIVNCARGGIINEQDLVNAVESGQVSSFAVDVFENEPNVKDSPYMNTDKDIILTPHLGANTDDAQVNVAVDVANQIKDVLTGGLPTSAVNIPTLSPELLEPVRAYVKLATNVAEIAKQISDDDVKAIEMKFEGIFAELETSPLETAILKGVLASYIKDVTFVNAPQIAEEKNIKQKISKLTSKNNYLGCITVKVVTANGSNTVTGAVISKDIQRIVHLNEFCTNIEGEEHMLLIPHDNKPLMIAQVANVIGHDNVNINAMFVAPNSDNKNHSFMVINTDKEVPTSSLDKIEAINGVINAKYVHLS